MPGMLSRVFFCLLLVLALFVSRVSYAEITIGEFELVSSETTENDKYMEYVYRLSVTNDGTEALGRVDITISATAQSIYFVDTSLTFGYMQPGAQAQSLDTFSFRLVKNRNYDMNNLPFRYDMKSRWPRMGLI